MSVVSSTGSAMPAEARQSLAAELQQELPSEDGAPNVCGARAAPRRAQRPRPARRCDQGCDMSIAGPTGFTSASTTTVVT